MSSSISRSAGRSPTQTRAVSIQPHYYDYAEGSCLVAFGNTQVICAATIDENVPPHLRNKGLGWVTGEYSMLPKASKERIRREREKLGGRTHEIQRLIGRSLRSVVNNQGWGERTITLDCDVIRADGGTRTASITGAFVAMVLAFRTLKKTGKIPDTLAFPVRDFVSAISVGVVKGVCVSDLDYPEDSNADTDMNVVMTSNGNFIEVQGTAEKEPFSIEILQQLLSIARQSCLELCAHQKKAIGELSWT